MSECFRVRVECYAGYRGEEAPRRFTLGEKSTEARGFLAEILRQVESDRNAPIALICRTGNRTTQVRRFLLRQGFTQVYNVREGMAGSDAGPGWLRRGWPIDPCRHC